MILKKYKEEGRSEGITLIALIITISVLLILVGVSIAMITGENGILTQAQNAKNKTEEAQDKEKISLAVSEAQIGNNGYQDLEQNNLQEAMNNQFDGRNVVVSDNGDGTFIVSVLDKLKDYTISGNTIQESTDWNKLMQDAKAPTSQNKVNEEGDKIIGLGTDGSVVNMDLWNCILLDDGTYSVSYSTRAEDIVNGNIIGTIPQYIKDGNEFKVVTSLENCFIDNNSIKYPPKIPNTITNIKGAFMNCVNLEKSATIPYGVIDMEGSFSGCINLQEMPEIPNSVKSLAATFVKCILITEMKPLPDSITNMVHAFNGCTNLKNISNIPKHVQYMNAAFSGCTSLTEVNLTIPETVTNLQYTFQYCTNLTGNITIDASVDGTLIDGLVDYIGLSVDSVSEDLSSDIKEYVCVDDVLKLFRDKVKIEKLDNGYDISIFGCIAKSVRYMVSLVEV